VLALVTFLPPGKVLVSGYESSSKDSTATWLHLLQAFLDMARIPSLIVTNPLPVLLEEVQVVDPQELDYMFYDIWVAHDISGRRFDKGGRLLQHNASAERFAAGMPFPVQCCWNGLAVINAAPFQ
ncbi:uncharacterized protein HaLaN_11879, partial [Haematococcus lacustris]